MGEKLLKELIFNIADILPEQTALRLKKRLVAFRNSSGTLSERVRSSQDAFMPSFDRNFKWINRASFSDQVPLFSHTGSMGDILFSLYFCKEFTEHLGLQQFDLHIQTGVADSAMQGHRHPYGNVRITANAAEFMKPLLLCQKYIRNVTCADTLPENAIQLDRFRKLKINQSSGQIQNWYYNLTDLHLPREFWKPVLHVGARDKYRGKVVLSATSRYRNVYIDCNALKPFREQLVFAGTQEEFNEFSSEFFDIPRIEADNLLEYAEYFAGTKGFLGNQGGLFSVAECLKIPRILASPEYTVFKGIPGPGQHVNHPQGGWCEDAATTEKMIAALKALLNR